MASLCYIPRFQFAAPDAVSLSTFGLFPKISTTVENTVENVVGRLS